MELDKGSIHMAQYLMKMPPKEVLEKVNTGHCECKETVGTKESRNKVRKF